MTIDILGVHINMMLNLNVLQWPLWIAQLIIAAFFASGFSTRYQTVYHISETTTVRWRRISARALLLVLGIGTGIILHLMGYMVGPTAMMFHNLGLFLLTIPLFDFDLNIGELLLRVAGFLTVWYMHFEMAYGSSNFWWSLVLMVIGVLVMRVFKAYFRKRMWRSLLLELYFALAFWIFLPKFSSAAERGMIIFQAVVMFEIMAFITVMIWSREHREALEHDRLKQLANYDQLTNAKTYSLYREELTQMFNDSKAGTAPLTLIALDIDHFKQINDHYGHLAGNSILIGVATTLSDTLNAAGKINRLYRTGGEEFNIAIPGQTPDDVLPLIEKCWEAVRQAHYHYKDFDVAVTMSAGVTAVSAGDASIDDTYKRADDNLYLSKSAGRDAITVEGQTINRRTDRNLIATYTYFTQAIVQVIGTERTPYRSELLLRMFDHEHDRWILPKMFDISLDTQIDLMQRTLSMSSVRRLSINLTNKQFCDEDIAKQLAQFANSPEGPDELSVEIVDVPDIQTTRKITAIYRASNVHIYIDDVGSDNSYEVVRDLIPYVDGVKFAMQNLRKTNSAAKMQERISFWKEIADAKHLDFILEGVENEDEVTYARDELGITMFQGYYFSKPNLPSL